MHFFKEAKLPDNNGSNLIICPLLSQPFLQDSDPYFQIAYTHESKINKVFLSFEQADKVFMNLTLDKNYQTSELITELQKLSQQLKIAHKAITNRSLIDVYEFTGTPREIAPLLPVLQEKLLKNLYVAYDQGIKALPELLVIFYNKIAKNIQTTSPTLT
ncbi:MAG: hypothetical protein JSR33_10165 [Proteobacteria bacterium]|nr:hypothetical protein [Pseudomonadota bacterium]